MGGKPRLPQTLTRFLTGVKGLATLLGHPGLVRWNNYKPRFGEQGYRPLTYPAARGWSRLGLPFVPIAPLFVVVVLMRWISAPVVHSGSASSADTTYYPNCADARSAGATPIRRGEPGYRDGLDRDGDGIACEPYRAW